MVFCITVEYLRCHAHGHEVSQLLIVVNINFSASFTL